MPLAQPAGILADIVHQLGMPCWTAICTRETTKQGLDRAVPWINTPLSGSETLAG